jgi:hypothetical protein
MGGDGCLHRLHLLMSAKVGGIPLLLSILSYQFRPKDSPALWRENILQWWYGLRPTLAKEWLKLSFSPQSFRDYRVDEPNCCLDCSTL